MTTNCTTAASYIAYMMVDDDLAKVDLRTLDTVKLLALRDEGYGDPDLVAIIESILDGTAPAIDA